MTEARITRSISNLGQRKRDALFTGIEGTRDYLRRAGADGLAWTPLRSVLRREIHKQIQAGTFENRVGGVALIGTMDQTFAPTIAEIRERHNERKSRGEGFLSRIKKLGREAIEFAAMPSSVKSLEDLEQVADSDVESYIHANVYPQHFKVEDTLEVSYEAGAQITADTAEYFGTTDMDILRAELLRQGIFTMSFSSYNAERRSLTGETKLPDWREWLPRFAADGRIRQISVSLNRDDLPDETGKQAMQNTHTMGEELLKDEPDETKMGDFAEQLRVILANLPKHGLLDISLRGPIAKYKPEQIKTIFDNIYKIGGINREEA